MSASEKKEMYKNSATPFKLIVCNILIASLFGGAIVLIIPLMAKFAPAPQTELTIRPMPEVLKMTNEVKEIKQEDAPKQEVEKSVAEAVLQVPEVPEPDWRPTGPITLELSAFETTPPLAISTAFERDYVFSVEDVKVVSQHQNKVSEITKQAFRPVPGLVVATSFSGKTFNAEEVDRQARKITGKTPVYPYRARRRNITGQVVIACVIDKYGQVTNPIVVKASPEGIFEASCLEAIKGFVYKPAVKNGTAVKQRLEVIFNFDFT